jgi:hypothetical protein
MGTGVFGNHRLRAAILAVLAVKSLYRKIVNEKLGDSLPKRVILFISSWIDPSIHSTDSYGKLMDGFLTNASNQ